MAETKKKSSGKKKTLATPRDQREDLSAITDPAVAEAKLGELRREREQLQARLRDGDLTVSSAEIADVEGAERWLSDALVGIRANHERQTKQAIADRVEQAIADARDTLTRYVKTVGDHYPQIVTDLEDGIRQLVDTAQQQLAEATEHVEPRFVAGSALGAIQAAQREYQTYFPSEVSPNTDKHDGRPGAHALSFPDPIARLGVDAHGQAVEGVTGESGNHVPGDKRVPTPDPVDVLVRRAVEDAVHRALSDDDELDPPSPPLGYPWRAHIDDDDHNSHNST